MYSKVIYPNQHLLTLFLLNVFDLNILKKKFDLLFLRLYGHHNGDNLGHPGGDHVQLLLLRQHGGSAAAGAPTLLAPPDGVGRAEQGKYTVAQAIKAFKRYFRKNSRIGMSSLTVRSFIPYKYRYRGFYL
jgi:hypothetical protein